MEDNLTPFPIYEKIGSKKLPFPFYLLNERKVSRGHLKMMVAEIEKVVEDYGLRLEGPLLLEFSSFMTNTYGNINCTWRHESKTLVRVHIKISLKSHLFFGIDRTIGVLRHELAHWLDFEFNGHFGHTDTFKEICLALGGSMNGALATGKYASCKDDRYFYGLDRWEYRCPVCNESFKTRYRRKRTYKRGCKKCKTPLALFKEARLT